MEKNSSELQEIFDLNRDDIRRLVSAKVLNPQMSGQGVASKFGVADVHRLIDIKMYLLAGYRISDMENIFTEDYDADKGITDQIHTYKKRIQILEFIRTIRKDIKRFEELTQNKVYETGKQAAKNMKLPEFGSVEYFDSVYEYLRFLLLVDALCQTKNIKFDDKAILRKVLSATSIAMKIIPSFGVEIDKQEVKEIFESITYLPAETEDDVKKYVKEFVEEFRENEDEEWRNYEREVIYPMVEGMEANIADCYKEMMMHMFQFTREYFFDEEEILCIYSHLRRFAKNLDKKALERGEVKLVD